MAQRPHRPEEVSVRPAVAGALILGAALLASSYLIASSLDRASERLEGVSKAMTEAVKTAAAARPAAAPAARGRAGRPGPGSVLSIKTAGSPVRGAKTAKVKIVEISDFQ